MKRLEDPVVQNILQYLREVNIQEPDYSAIKRILEEGADGRYIRIHYSVCPDCHGLGQQNPDSLVFVCPAGHRWSFI